MECTPLFVLDLGKKQILIAGALSWPPPILGQRLFVCSRGPLGNETVEAERGEMGGERGSQGKGGVPEITLLTSQFSTGTCPAHLC